MFLLQLIGQPNLRKATTILSSYLLRYDSHADKLKCEKLGFAHLDNQELLGRRRKLYRLRRRERFVNLVTVSCPSLL